MTDPHSTEQLAPVHYLHHDHEETEEHETEPDDVIEGEVISEEEYQRLTTQRHQARERLAGYRSDAVAVARSTRAVATHPVTRSTGARVVVAGVTTVQGVQSWAKRAWDASTLAAYRRQMASAEAAGDREAAADWADRLESAKEKRHRRIMDLPRMAANIVKVGLGSLAAFVALVLMTGVLVQLTGTASFMDPIYGIFNAIRWGIIIVSAGWVPAVAVTPVLLLLAAWREGKRRQTPPQWVQRMAPGPRDGGTVVTADGIVRALQHLSIAKMDQAFKRDWVPAFETPPIKDGNGYRAVLELPEGVTPSMVADKRDVLAKNLQRIEVEVWPSDAAKADGRPGYLDLWVADSGVLSKPAPEYPLLHSGTADVFAGVPIGVTQRGDELALELVDSNFVFGGMMGQGKSNGGRVLMLGAALDPMCELWVHVFAGNGDFDAYQPRLARYRRGATDETAAAGLQSLQELYEEVGRREARLADLGAKKITRKLAEQHPDLRPLVSFYSECHELFGHKDFGEQAADYAVQVIRRGRKTGVILGFDTQSSRKEAIPPKIVELVKLNCCFAVKTWRSNDGFLGDGSFASGVRATQLRPYKDRGTCVVTGATSEAFEIVKTHFVAVDDDTGWDAATDVIARAMQTVHTDVPTGATDTPTPIETDRDLLDDLDAVLGDEPVPSADVPALLTRHAPKWAPYQRLTGKELRARLADEYGIKVPSTGNRYPVDPTTVRSKQAELATGDLDSEE